MWSDEVNLKDSIELLNSLKYQNYGLLFNSDSIDLSNTNRLALCTNKSIFILNTNFDWPSSLNNTSPFKLFLNNSKSPVNQKQTVHVDSWIQDLSETRNESFYLNIIRSVPKSTHFTNIFKAFFTLEEYTQANKQKSFYKQLQDVMKKSTSSKSQIKSSNEACSTSIDQLISSDSEQYFQHRKFYEQTKIYDTDYSEFLSYLNPFSSGSSQEQTSQLDAFKLCKWNTRSNLNVLFTLTQFNQMILFDCTQLRCNNTVNVLSSVQQDGNDQKTGENEYISVFDAKTGSKMINLTDFLILNYRKNLLNPKFKTIEEFLDSLDKIIPVCVTWVGKVFNFGSIEFEVLFIAFKSNEIGVFLIHTGDDNGLRVELFDMIKIDDKLVNENENDEFIDVDIVRTNKPKYFITEIKYLPIDLTGILAVGFSNGKLLISKYELSASRLKKAFNDSKLDLDSKSLSQLKDVGLVDNGALGPIKKVEVVKLKGYDSEYMIVAQSENELEFLIVSDAKTGLIQVEDSFMTFKLNEANYKQTCNNYLTKNSFKLIEFKLLNEDNLKILLILENSFIELLSLKIEANFRIHLSHKVINNSMDINFDNLSNKPSNCPSLFKSTKQIFTSSNSFLIFQINDFTKSSLIQKRPPNFQINIYRLKSINRNEIENYFDEASFSYNGQDLVKLNDFLWLFKRDLYLKNEGLFKSCFDTIYDNLKNFRTKLNKYTLKDSKLVYLKRLRILTYFIGNYFETISNFEAFNSKVSHTEEKDSDDESDYIDEEEMDIDINSEQVKIKVEPADMEENTDVAKETVVKSISYYKSILREVSLMIFKYHTFEIILKGYEAGYEKLNDREKLLLIVLGEFCINKNFMEDFQNHDLTRLELENWLRDLSSRSSTNQGLINLFDKMNCDLCGCKFKIESSLDLEKLKCESGHIMNRCEKTLLPLNNFKFKKCQLCNSKWNGLQPNDEYPSFRSFISNRVDYCLFCD